MTDAVLRRLGFLAAIGCWAAVAILVGRGPDPLGMRPVYGHETAVPVEAVYVIVYGMGSMAVLLAVVATVEWVRGR